MKAIRLFFTVLVCVLTWSVSAQNRKPNYSPNGGVFTPKGDMRVLVIYAGFGNANGSGSEKLPHWRTEDGIKSLPEYVNKRTGAAPDLIYSSNEDFEALKSKNLLNISRLYYEMSLGQFRMVGDVFKDPNTGKPVRINIDPAEIGPDFPQPAKSWGDCNYRVLHKMRELYPDFDWSPYDNRKNSPKFKFDNSETGPDNKPDYVIIIYRHAVSWARQPIKGMNRWYGAGGGYSVLDGVPAKFEYNGYTFDRAGFTQPEGKGNAQQILKFIEHEIAHELYACPHVMGANGAAGDRFSFCSSGWGMMSSWDKLNKTANAWERWVLGWIDLKTGPEGTPSDIRNEKFLVNEGVYTLRDFVTSGDAVRIRIPHTKDQYLWIENHQKESIFDECPWANTEVSKDGEVVPPMDKGIYMYVENILGNRNKIYPGLPGRTASVNGIKILNAQGNYDYTHEEIAQKPSWDYFWYNTMFTFRRGEENPISGLNPFQSFPDDYPRQATKRGGEDQKIKHSNYFNGGGNEVQKIIRETNGRDTILALGHLGGVNRESKRYLNRRSPAFQVGDKVGLSGIVPVLNFPKYKKVQAASKPYLLNGLQVEVVGSLPNGEMMIKVSFDEYTLSENKRWTGDLVLSAHPGHRKNNLKVVNNSLKAKAPMRYSTERPQQATSRNQVMGERIPDQIPDRSMKASSASADEGKLHNIPTKPSLIVAKDVKLLLNRSGIPNRHTPGPDNNFINPTKLTLNEGAFMLQEAGSEVLVLEGTSLILKAGSRLELKDGATLKLDRKCTLVIENGAQLVVRSGAEVLIGKGATLRYENRQGARGITLEPHLNPEDHGLVLAGNLQLENQSTFRFLGKGSIEAKKSHQLIQGSGSTLQLYKGGRGDRVWSNDPER